MQRKSLQGRLSSTIAEQFQHGHVAGSTPPAYSPCKRSAFRRREKGHMTLSFEGSEIRVDGRAFTTPWSVLDAYDDGTQIIVLLNPDDYLTDPTYRERTRAGAPAIKNLVAYTYEGRVIWEADFPDESDYYYRIHSRKPLRANCFSSHRCEIDALSGKIVETIFFK